jgi:hypothetical protein
LSRHKTEFPEALRVRLTVEQMSFLQAQADASDSKVSDLVRSLIQKSMNEWHAQISRQASDYLHRFDAVAGGVRNGVTG